MCFPEMSIPLSRSFGRGISHLFFVCDDVVLRHLSYLGLVGDFYHLSVEGTSSYCTSGSTRGYTNFRKIDIAMNKER
jgi:hypothetical protein